MKRVERIRIYPSAAQAARLHFVLDVTRQLYNAALQERRDAYRGRRIKVDYKQQYAELTALRSASGKLDSRLSAVYRECEDAVLWRLDLAMKAFFRRVAAGETAGYPRFKPASRWKQVTFPHGDRALRFNAEQTRLTVPGIGKIPLRKGRHVPPYGRAWIVERNQRWYACFETERREVQGPAAVGRILGVDRGSHVLAATSDGVLYPNAAAGERRRRATARLQRELEAVSERDTAGRVLNRLDPKRQAAVLRLARAKEREANARRDALHKTARKIVDSADTIALEDLRLLSMTRSAKGTVARPGSNVKAKAALNRRMLDASLGQLHRLIAEKAEEATKRVVLVAAHFSSQECPRCGACERGSRRRRRFCCVRCGYRNHADVSAALVIRGRAESRLLSLPIPAAEAGHRARRAE